MRALTLLVLALAGCAPRPPAVAIIAEHCAACHRVPGVPGAVGRVGPSLAGIGRQQIIAGYFPNSRHNLVLWISEPQRLLPGNAMPDTGLTPQEANQVADYLYTLDK